MDRQLRLDTSFGAGTQRYSFIETPLEMNPSRQRIERQVPLQEPETKVDACPFQHQGTVTEDVQPSYNEKAQLQHESAASVYPGSPPIEQHPAHYAPYAEDAPQQAQFDTVAPAYSYSAGPDPRPVKTDPDASGLLATVQHTRTRKAYGISGNVGSDCVRATCCTCCTLIQDEKEFKTREEERERVAWATGQALVSPYATPLQMSYGQPPR
ncbi:hypothetical protein EMGR_003706 [Emarellia grisea]